MAVYADPRWRGLVSGCSDGRRISLLLSILLILILVLVLASSPVTTLVGVRVTVRVGVGVRVGSDRIQTSFELAQVSAFQFGTIAFLCHAELSERKASQTDSFGPGGCRGRSEWSRYDSAAHEDCS